MKNLAEAIKGKMLYIFGALIIVLLQGCVHDYPENGGDDPSLIELGIELTLDLKWNQRAENIKTSTRARGNYNHRVIVEISRGGKQIGREIILLTPEEFALGSLKHKLSFKLHALEYDMAVWSDFINEDGSELAYSASHLNDISQIDPGISWNEDMSCGYAGANLDLRQYRGKWDAKVIKELELRHAGARFRIIATDIREFVEAQKHALQNGETYTLTINYATGTPEGFDAYTGIPLRGDLERQLTGKFEIPFSLDAELDLAQCFLFCSEEENITMSLTVHNSARMIVVRTQNFRFTVRRGYITVVRGDFLSDYFTNLITVDNIWAGEIVIEI